MTFAECPLAVDNFECFIKSQIFFEHLMLDLISPNNSNCYPFLFENSNKRDVPLSIIILIFEQNLISPLRFEEEKCIASNEYECIQ